MADLEHARMLLDLAKDDLAALEVLMGSWRVSANIYGFHAQQAVEKGLKAWLSLEGVLYPRTHSLGDLMDLLEDNSIDGASQFRSLQRLTPFAVQLRYETSEALEEDLNRNAVFDRVNSLVVFLESLLKNADAGS
jgi:HEPN domain-containing protein